MRIWQLKIETSKSAPTHWFKWLFLLSLNIQNRNKWCLLIFSQKYQNIAKYAKKKLKFSADSLANGRILKKFWK